MNRTIVSTLLASTSILLLATSASAAAPSADRYMNGKSIYGEPVSASGVSKVVNIGSTKYINIRCGDVVTFVNAGKQFTWKFDVASHRSVNLSKVAPADFGGNGLMVYVEANDLERDN